MSSGYTSFIPICLKEHLSGIRLSATEQSRR